MNLSSSPDGEKERRTPVYAEVNSASDRGRRFPPPRRGKKKDAGISSRYLHEEEKGGGMQRRSSPVTRGGKEAGRIPLINFASLG